MKTLITGATGFLGTHLNKRLLKNGEEVVGIGSRDCDLTQQGALERKFGDDKFNQIFHLAAWTQAGDFCLHHPGEQWIINQQINTNVLNWWKNSQPKAKMISMGTSCSYDSTLELKEENYLKGKPIESLFTYAQTKRMLFTGLMAFQKQFDMDYLHFVPSTLYGPGYHTDGRQMHFIFDLMRKILSAKENGSQVTLWGDGNQKRELVHVEDFIDAMLDINKNHKNDILNIGAGEGHSIKDFAEMICEIVKYDSSKIKYDTSKYVGAKSKIVDVSKMRSMYQGNFRDIREGISETIDWMKDNKEKIYAKK